MNKKLLIPGLAVASVIAAGVVLNTSVYADSESSFPPRIQEMVERFNLDESEVENFLNEKHQERMAEREAEVESKLNDAVSEGTITEDQKALILAKMEENRTNKEDMRDLSREEKQEQAQTHREDMQTWAEQNGIDLEDLNLGRRGTMEGQGKRGDAGRGMGSPETE